MPDDDTDGVGLMNSRSGCEFCGKNKPTCKGTEFHGGYCAGCLELSILADEEELRELKKKKVKK